MDAALQSRRDGQLLLLPRLQPGKVLLLLLVLIRLLRLNLLHYNRQLLLSGVIRTQQLSLLLKLQNLQSFFL
jgi:hypothetical protein